MWMQWLITGGIVAACLAYAIKSLAPRFSQAKGGGCGGGCSGCDQSATPCATTQADYQPLQFHPPQSGKN